MNRQSQDPEPAERGGAVAVEGDPWVDFLSESSGELDTLKSELLTAVPRPGPDDAPVAGVPDVEAVEPPEIPAETRAHTLPRPTSASVVFLKPEFNPESESERPGEGSPQGAMDVTDPVIDRGGEEPAPAQVPHSSPDSTTGHASLSVADVLQRQVTVQWSEAVAVVEALCSVLVRDGRTRTIPDPRHVRITTGGAVLVSNGKGRHDIASLGRMLHALLATASPPLPLRLFVTSAISSPRFDTIELFADALSHYAVPNGRERIERLCRRALAAAVTSVPRVGQPVRPDARARRGGRRWLVRAAVAALALACSAAAGAWFARGTAGDAPITSITLSSILPGVFAPSASEPPAEAAVEDPAPAAPPAASTSPSRPSAAPPPPPASDPSAGVSQGARPESQADRQAAPRTARAAVTGGGTAPAVPAPVPPQEAPVQAPVAIATAGAPATGPVGSLPGPAPPAASAPPDPATTGPEQTPIETEAEALPGGSIDTAIVYTSADPDVQPPVVLTEGGLAPPPSLLETETRPAVELVIDERGVVESVQTVGRPRNLAYMMWLSSLKYQRFRPAMKGGSPVPYRLRVR